MRKAKPSFSRLYINDSVDCLVRTSARTCHYDYPRERIRTSDDLDSYSRFTSWRAWRAYEVKSNGIVRDFGQPSISCYVAGRTLGTAVVECNRHDGGTLIFRE